MGAVSAASVLALLLASSVLLVDGAVKSPPPFKKSPPPLKLKSPPPKKKSPPPKVEQTLCNVCINVVRTKYGNYATGTCAEFVAKLNSLGKSYIDPASPFICADSSFQSRGGCAIMTSEMSNEFISSVGQPNYASPLFLLVTGTTKTECTDQMYVGAIAISGKASCGPTKQFLNGLTCQKPVSPPPFKASPPPKAIAKKPPPVKRPPPPKKKSPPPKK